LISDPNPARRFSFFEKQRAGYRIHAVGRRKTDMDYSVSLYVVNPRRKSFFISSMRGRGVYCELARRTLPGFMGIDLLRNHKDASEFLCLTFWTSVDKYAAAQSSSNQAVLARFLEKLTITSAHLWTFSFPAPERLIPRFPGTHLTDHTGKPTGVDQGLVPDQSNADGDSWSNCQP
jgi:heme-degrading monooxygenase HmoA